MGYNPSGVNPYAPSRMPSRPFGVALLAVLIGIYGVILVLAGVAIAALSSLFTFQATLEFLSLTGLVLGLVLFVLGLVFLGVAIGLWHQRLWALILCVVVLGIFLYSALVPWTGISNISIWFVVELILFVYLLAVHRHFL